MEKKFCWPGQSQAVRVGMGRTLWLREATGLYRNVSLGWMDDIPAYTRDGAEVTREEFRALMVQDGVEPYRD